MRTDLELPWWMYATFSGNEGEGDSGGDGGDSGDGGDDAGDGDDDGDSGDGTPDDADVDGLKSALAKERNGNKTNAKEVRRLQRELAAAQKKVDEAADKDKTEAEKAAKRATAAEEKAAKLATRLRTQELDRLIEREARGLKFIDIDDALSQVDRSLIAVEQDEDDPADIEVDAKTVKAAVKALADKKKHLIASDDDGGSGGPSGSRFNGPPKDKAKASEDKLKELYPALRG